MSANILAVSSGVPVELTRTIISCAIFSSNVIRDIICRACCACTEQTQAKRSHNSSP